MGRKSTRKPLQGLPIFLHATGQYCWKCRGKFHYLGKDPKAAVERYLRESEWVRAGKQAPERLASELPLRTLLDDYLHAKRLAVDAGTITERRWEDIRKECLRTLEVLDGARPFMSIPNNAWRQAIADLSDRLGPTTRKVWAANMRGAINWAVRDGLIPDVPQILDALRGPDAREISRHRYRVTTEQGLRLFTATEVRQLLEACDAGATTDRAVVLLAINCAFEPHDLACLSTSLLPDLNACPAWLDYPRPKTGIPRRVPLWPVTLAAVKTALDTYWAANGLQTGTQAASWLCGGHVATPKGFIDRFRRLTDRAGIHRKGVGILGLRRSFATIAGETGDQAAVDLVMGHRRHDMASVYRQGISDPRLMRVADIVHRWVFDHNVPEWESGFASDRLPFQ